MEKLFESSKCAWVATEDKLVRYDEKRFLEVSKQAGDAVVCMAVGVDGTVWVGTESGGIWHLEDEGLILDPAVPEDAPQMIRCIEAAADGGLWIGYAGDGLGRIKDGRFSRITTSVGLADDYLSQMRRDQEGKLWVAGNHGLFQLDEDQVDSVMEGEENVVRSRVFGTSEGLPALHPERGAFPSSWITSEREVLFSMRGGLLVAQTGKAVGSRKPPEVLIERVTMDDDPVALYGNRAALSRMGEGKVLDLSIEGGVLHLPPDYRKLKIRFSALSFSSPENVRFRHRLKGFDPGWVDAEMDEAAVYPRLPAGRFEFQVIASSGAGVWNETGKLLLIEVAPFFWETWWFRAGSGAGILLLVGGLVFMFQRRKYRRELTVLATKREIENERARIARDIHDDLGSNLTRIMLLSQPRRQGVETGAGGNSVLQQIHFTSRNLIREMSEVVWAVNPEQDTLEGLADYLGSYAQEFLHAAGIRCWLDISALLPQLPLSTQLRHGLLLAFKEALNNVAKHSGATEVSVSLAVEECGLVLSVKDNGKGLETSENSEEYHHGPGYGLTSMTDRLRVIGGTCEILHADDRGTTVVFKIPRKSFQKITK